MSHDAMSLRWLISTLAANHLIATRLAQLALSCQCMQADQGRTPEETRRCRSEGRELSRCMAQVSPGF